MRAPATFGLPTALLVTTACLSCDEVEPIVAQTVVLRAVPAQLDLGLIPLLSQAEDNVVLANAGNAAWNTTVPPRIEGAGFAWVGGCDAPLAPGATCTARVRFAPDAERPHEGTLTFAGADDELDDIVVTLVGGGAPANIVLLPSALEFGDVLVGRSATLTATLENRGREGVTVPLLTAAPFFVDGTPGGRSVVVAAGARVDVPIVFAPTTGGPASGVLRATTCGPACGPSATLRGSSAAPRLDVAPRTLDLGAVAAGSVGEGPLTVANRGDAPLSLQAVDVDGDAAFAVDAPPLPLTLAPGEAVVVVVRWAPTQGVAAATAVVVFRSSDPLAPAAFVPVSASSPGAGLVVLPAQGHLGFLDPDEERELAVVARAAGDAPVRIDDLRVVGGGGAFVLVGPPDGVVLAPGESAQFLVRGRALPAAVQAGGATARIVVDTAELPDQGVDVAFLAGTAGCVPRPVLAHVALGAVRIGEQAAGDAVVTNAGDAPCTLVDVRPGENAGLPASPSMEFDARGLRSLAPGASGVVRFAFSPRSEAPASATAVVTFAEGAAPVLVSASGRGARGGLVAIPTTVELGPVAQGCRDVEGAALLFADGGAAITVDTVGIEPVLGPLALLPLSLPVGLLPGETVRVVMTGDADAAVGVHEAMVRAGSDGGDAAVRVTLTVAPANTPIEERFVAADIDAVDVLFIVDNSGSMLDDQALLASNFSSFFALALTDRSIDFRLGVTTTDVLSPGAAGGRLVGSVLDRFTPELESAFAAQVQVGADGSGLELGLEALRLALEDPADQRLIRPEAALSVVFVTDEEDTGAFPEFLPDPALAREPAEYVALLQAKKDGALANTPVLVSAVITPGFATRYEALVDEFGGTALDITSPTWGQQLSAIGVDTFSLARAFVLTADAVPGSVSVTVDGRSSMDFAYDDARHAVVLGDAPHPGAEVVVRYVPECS